MPNKTSEQIHKVYNQGSEFRNYPEEVRAEYTYDVLVEIAAQLARANELKEQEIEILLDQQDDDYDEYID